MQHAAEFRCALRGRRAGRSTLVAYFSVKPGAGDDARIGFIVSRAVGGAVARNRVKRQLRHLIRPDVGRLPAGSLLVIRALPAAAAEPSRLARDVDSVLRKLLPASTSDAR